MQYLELYHGRKDPDQIMEEGFGFEGPIIGPLTQCIVTYMNIVRIRFKSEAAAQKSGFDYDNGDPAWLQFHDDMVFFQGNYYGDFSIEDFTKEELLKRNKWEGRVHAIPHKKYTALTTTSNIID